MSITFGPINSRRFGKSLGIDLSPKKKQCNFDCLYCELEPAKTVGSYEDVIAVDDIIKAVKVAIDNHPDIDVLTVTANGEPTLYPHLEELMLKIEEIKGDIKSLILSNGSTISEEQTQRALELFDTVKLSLDCATPKCLKRLDRAYKSVNIETIKRGMVEFRAKFKRDLIIEILIVKDINSRDSEIEELNRFLVELKPTRVDIGTIDRPPAYRVEPLTYEELRAISLKFSSELPIQITSRKRVEGKPSSYSRDEIVDTLKKRPLTLDDIETLFDRDSIDRLNSMVQNGEVKVINSANCNFFVVNL